MSAIKPIMRWYPVPRHKVRMMYAEDACLAQAAHHACRPDERRRTIIDTGPIAVMACSDSISLHATMRTMQGNAPGIRLLAGPCDGDTCLHTCMSSAAPQLVLFDKDWLDIADPRLLNRLREQCPRIRILLAWDREPPALVTDVARHLLDGFLPIGSSPDVYRKAIEAVIHGELWLSREMMTRAIAALHAELHVLERHTIELHATTPAADVAGTLTPRETEVVLHLRRGFTNKEIARELGIMEDTVKKHLQNIFAKLGVKRRTLVALSLGRECATS